MKVLIIAEDPTLDQHILKPVAEQLFKDLGKRVRADILWEPRLKGTGQALDAAVLHEIVRDNPMEDLFLLLIDRDCNRFKNAERAAAREQEHHGKLLACLAVHEVEVWALALHREELALPWADVRRHCDPKEAFWDPFAEKSGWDEAGILAGGRKRAMRDLGRQWRGLLEVCPEIADLRERIASWMKAVD